MAIADIEKIIERMESVKVLKSVALKVFQMANDPQATALDITDVVEGDDYLSALILKVANSSYYGNAGNVRSINDAVVLLGFTGIKSIAVAASLMVRKDDGTIKKSEIIVRERLWRHALSTAIASKFIAEKTGFGDTGQAYITGIIHDIGRLAIFQYDEKKYHAIENYSLEKGVAMIDAETAVTGFDHAQIGAIILHKWGFPEAIVQAVAYHHRFFEDLQDRDLIGVVAIANFISNSLGFGAANIPAMDSKILKMYGLDYDKIKKFIEQISGILSHIDILSLGL
jgi:putative nucleotidyltransferase with HDIG domain